MNPLLTEAQIAQQLTQTDGWTRMGDALHRDFQFDDFVAAFGFIAQVALLAERADHHPDWRNVYNKVYIQLSTHEAGGITAKDFHLAQAINALLKR